MTNDVQYTDVDLNATATTTVFDPDHDGEVYGVFMANTGSTAVAQLESGDGSSSAVLTPGQTGGDPIELGDTLAIDGDQTLDVVVTTAEGASLTGTVAVFVG